MTNNYHARVKLGNTIEFEIDAYNETELRKLVDDMTDKFLSNSYEMVKSKKLSE